MNKMNKMKRRNNETARKNERLDSSSARKYSMYKIS